MQAWKDIENFLHGDRSALHSGRRHHHQHHKPLATTNDVEDPLTSHTDDYTTSNNEDFVDVATTSSGMFPRPGDVLIPRSADTTATIRSLEHNGMTITPHSAMFSSPENAHTTVFAARGEATVTVDCVETSTMMIPSHGDAIVPVAGNAGTSLFPGHGEPGLMAGWEDCFTPPVSPTAEMMTDAYDDLTDFNFMLHHSSCESVGAATEQYNGTELDVAPPPLNALQQDCVNAYYPHASGTQLEHQDWYGTTTYGTANDERSFQNEMWTASCDCAQCRLYPPAQSYSQSLSVGIQMSSSHYHHHHQQQQQQQQYSLQPDTSQYMTQYPHSGDVYYDVNTQASEPTDYSNLSVSTPPISPTDFPSVCTSAGAGRIDSVNYSMRYDVDPVSAVWDSRASCSDIYGAAMADATRWSSCSWRHEYHLDSYSADAAAGSSSHSFCS